LRQKKYLRKRFDKARVLIIDEISMLLPQTFDLIERLCRAMKRKEAPFGNMQIVLSGDFFQLPPILRGGSSVEFVNTSEAWKGLDIRVCYLDEQYRHKDRVFEEILKEMRRGAVSVKSREILSKQNNKKFPDGLLPTRLYTHNKDVEALNEKELIKLPGQVYEYAMRTKGRASLVESLKRGILAPEVLRLKKDAKIMFVKNNFEAGYVNGTLGQVEDFKDGLPIVRAFSGDIIDVEPVEWRIKDEERTLARAEQLPLRLAWAITIHKSQGMNIDAAEIDLSKSFVPGQGYVALSRLRTLNGLVLSGINEMALAMNQDVLKLDSFLLAESSKWEKALTRFSQDEMKAMHQEFIEKSGGTLDEKEIAKNKEQGSMKIQEKVSTYEKTRELIEKSLSLEEITKERGLAAGTILSHFEKLHGLNCGVDFEKFKPAIKDLEKIKEAFIATGDTKLSPVYEIFGGEYTYEELRLARLFL